MDSDSVQMVRPRPHWPFLPLFFSMAGWALLHTWLHLMDANFRAHLIAVVLGMAFSTWSLFPLQGKRFNVARTIPSTSAQSGLAATSSASFFLLLGAILGGLVINGSLFLLAAGATLLNFVPWGRLKLDQRSVAAPCLFTICGFGVVLFAGWSKLDMLALPFATWAFWLATLIGFIRRAEQSRPNSTVKSTASNTEAKPANCDV